MTRGLTDKQSKILSFLETYVRDVGYPPSIREIGNHFDISSLRGVTVHLDALERKGMIKRANTSRSITIIGKTGATAPARNVVHVPLLGTIAAGIPITATQNIEAQLPVPQEMVAGKGNVFALKVKGESMIDKHIMPDDIVLIKESPVADNGDIVAFLIDDEATVKEIQFTARGVKLIPHNSVFDIIEVDRENGHIIGKVVGLLRNYDGGMGF